MSWKQYAIPFGADPLPIQEALYAVALSQAASGGQIDTRIAMFARNEDFERTILLLSPEAAKFADRLPGDWTDAGDPSAHGWALLYSAGAGHQDFGLRTPRD
jgi:hypothetical protein